MNLWLLSLSGPAPGFHFCQVVRRECRLELHLLPSHHFGAEDERYAHLVGIAPLVLHPNTPQAGFVLFDGFLYRLTKTLDGIWKVTVHLRDIGKTVVGQVRDRSAPGVEQPVEVIENAQHPVLVFFHFRERQPVEEMSTQNIDETCFHSSSPAKDTT